MATEDTIASNTEVRKALNHQQIERYAVFAFGIAFLVVILTLIVFIPKPTQAQFFVFRLVLALSAAGVGALIPGFIHYEQLLPFKGVLRVGGALALFSVVWFTNPGKLAIEGIAPPPAANARPLLEQAMRLVDGKDYLTSYGLYASGPRAIVSESSYAELFRTVREPLGDRLKGPKLINANTINEYMGTKGPFVIHFYQSRFSGHEGVIAEFVGAIAEEGEWRMYMHTIAPCMAPACLPAPGL